MIELTKVRKDQGLSQMKLAAKAGMHFTSISAIERGYQRPYLGQINKLVEALGWEGEPEDLFEEVED